MMIKAIPMDYEPQEYNITKTDADKWDYNDDQVVMTTIPSRSVNQASNPDGHSEWIVLGSTKAKVVNKLGYPKPIPRTSGVPAYQVKTTPNMGLGVFATRNIAAGELVFSERPLLVVPRDIAQMVNMSHIRKEYDGDAVKRITMAECERQLEIAVGRMLPDDQEAFRSLANTHREDGSGPLLGIIRTNGYEAEGLFDGPKVNEWGSNLYTAVTKIGSRINHSCRPNITHKFDLASFSFPFVAKRDILCGEQLLYSYCIVNQSAADRQAELAPYGFACECLSCVKATPESDKLRVEYQQKIAAAIKEVTSAFIRGGANAKTLEPLTNLKQQLLDEGLDTTEAYLELLKSMSHTCRKLGMDIKETEYLEEIKKYDSVLGK